MASKGRFPDIESSDMGGLMVHISVINVIIKCAAIYIYVYVLRIIP